MKCNKCGEEIMWSDLHELASALMWDSVFTSYVNAISEIRHLLRIAHELRKGDHDFGRRYQDVIALIQEVKAEAEKALAELGAEDQVKEVTVA